MNVPEPQPIPGWLAEGSRRVVCAGTDPGMDHAINRHRKAHHCHA